MARNTATFVINSKPAFVWMHSERGGLLGHFVQRRALVLAALNAVALLVGVLVRVIFPKRGEDQHIIDILFHILFDIVCTERGETCPILTWYQPVVPESWLSSVSRKLPETALGQLNKLITAALYLTRFVGGPACHARSSHVHYIIEL